MHVDQIKQVEKENRSKDHKTLIYKGLLAFDTEQISNPKSDSASSGRQIQGLFYFVNG